MAATPASVPSKPAQPTYARPYPLSEPVAVQPAMQAGWTLNRFLIVLGYAAFLVSVLVASRLKLEWFLDPTVPVLLAPMTLFTILLLFYARPWVQLVTAILISLPALVVLLLFGEIVGAVNPLLGSEFEGAHLHLLAILLALPAGIRGFVQGRKARTQNPLRGGLATRQGLYAVAVVLFFGGLTLAGALASIQLTEGGTGGGYDFVPAASVSVVQKNHAFEPKALTVTAGTLTEIVVKNEDGAFHTFTYKNGDAEYNHDVVGGATVKFLVKFDAAGTVAYRCTPHSSGYDDTAGMTGTITVT